MIAAGVKTPKAARPQTSLIPAFIGGRTNARECDGQGAAEAAPRPPLTEVRLVSLILLPLLILLPPLPGGAADLPDHAGRGNLDERSRTVGQAARKGRVGDSRQKFRWAESRSRIALPKVAHGAVIHQVGAVVGTELQIDGAVDPANPVDEGLLKGVVEGKPLELELERLTRSAEVDELDVVPLLRRAIRFREPEVSLAAGKGRTALDWSVDEGTRHEVKPDNCDVGRLKGQRRRDRLGWERENVLHRLTDNGGRIVVAGAPDGVENRLS